jgi:hypothetical protein
LFFLSTAEAGLLTVLSSLAAKVRLTRGLLGICSGVEFAIRTAERGTRDNAGRRESFVVDVREPIRWIHWRRVGLGCTRRTSGGRWILIANRNQVTQSAWNTWLELGSVETILFCEFATSSVQPGRVGLAFLLLESPEATIRLGLLLAGGSTASSLGLSDGSGRRVFLGIECAT